MQADAVHPGYGFLSERAAFAQAVRDAGLIFVGPTPEAMAAMGSKIEAKRRVRAFDVPTVPGYDGDDQSLATLRAQAQRIGFPLLIKASAGGGGRGMRVVESLAAFDEALESGEARSAGGVRRRRGAARTLSSRSAPHRVSNSRRRARRDDSSRRARMLDSAPPSEDRRGGAFGRAHAGAARRDGRRGRARRRIGRLRQRRDVRVHARRATERTISSR